MKKFLSLLACGAMFAGFASTSHAQVNIDKMVMGTGTGKTITLQSAGVANSLVLTIPDPGGAANVILSQMSGGQTITGGLTSTGTLTLGLNGAGGTPGTLTILDGGNAGTSGSIGFASGYFATTSGVSADHVKDADLSTAGAIPFADGTTTGLIDQDANFTWNATSGLTVGAGNVTNAGNYLFSNTGGTAGLQFSGAATATGTTLDIHGQTGGTSSGGNIDLEGGVKGTSGTDGSININTATGGNVTIGNTTGTTSFPGTVNFTTPPTFSSLTQGSTLFAGAGGAITQDNANYFWDETSKRLGIGTATPSVTVGSNAVGITVSNDDNDAFGDAHQITIQSSTHSEEELELGLNTHTGQQGSVQAYDQGIGPLPLALQPAGGDVGIGTGLTAPTHTLEVVGTTNISGAASIGGALGVTGLTSTNGGLTNTGAFTTSGGAASINDNSNLATTINTGTSTGAVHIGDGTGANSVSIGNTAGTVAIAASHWSVTSLGAASFASLSLTSPLAVAQGGTGQTSFTTGAILVGASPIGSVADVGTGEVLTSGGTGANPSYSASPTLSNLTLNPATATTGLTINTTGTAGAISLTGAGSGNDVSAVNWSVTHAGAATFAGVNAGAGTLQNTGNAQIGTGASTTNDFGTGTSDVNTIGTSTSPVSTTHILGTVDINGTAVVNGSGTTGTIPKWTAGSTLGNSLLTDNGTTLSYSGTNINSATDYQIGGTNVLTSSTLGSGVTGSSLTSVGTLTGGATGAGFTVALGTSTVTGTLAVANGGTGQSTALTPGAVIFGSTATAMGQTAAGNVGDLLTSAAAGTPTWTAQSGITAGNATNAANIGTTLATTGTFYPTFVSSNATSSGQAANVATALSFNAATGTLSATKFAGDGSLLTGVAASTATNLAGGAAGDIPWQSAASTTSMLAAGTANQILMSGGAATPAWSTATYPANVTAVGDLIYGSAAGTYSNLADAATGEVLTSGGTGVVPSYSATPSVTSLTATTSVTTPSVIDGAAMNVNPSANTGTPGYKMTVDGGGSSAVSGVGGNLDLAAGNATGTTSTGGNSYLDGGTGTTTNGGVFIGTLNAGEPVNIGNATGATNIYGSPVDVNGSPIATAANSVAYGGSNNTLATGTTDLFNVAYASNTDASVAGGVINSTTGLTTGTATATGLTLTAQATGGAAPTTTTGLLANASGDTVNTGSSNMGIVATSNATPTQLSTLESGLSTESNSTAESVGAAVLGYNPNDGDHQYAGYFAGDNTNSGSAYASGVLRVVNNITRAIPMGPTNGEQPTAGFFTLHDNVNATLDNTNGPAAPVSVYADVTSGSENSKIMGVFAHATTTATGTAGTQASAIYAMADGNNATAATGTPARVVGVSAWARNLAGATGSGYDLLGVVGGTDPYLGGGNSAPIAAGGYFYGTTGNSANLGSVGQVGGSIYQAWKEGVGGVLAGKNVALVGINYNTPSATNLAGYFGGNVVMTSVSATTVPVLSVTNTGTAASNVGASISSTGAGTDNTALSLSATGGTGTNTAISVAAGGGRTILSYVDEAASTTPYTIPNNVSVVNVGNTTGTAVLITMPAGVNGEVLYIYNSQTVATTGGAAIPASTGWSFIYVGSAWQHAQ